MKLFRGMRSDVSGKLPTTKGGKTSLDVSPDEISIIDGLAIPSTGGMSVVANVPEALPGHRKPPSYGGSAKHPIFWMLERALPQTLVARQDMPEDFPEHRSIEPREPCAFEQFRNEIVSTCPSWSVLNDP